MDLSRGNFGEKRSGGETRRRQGQSEGKGGGKAGRKWGGAAGAGRSQAAALHISKNAPHSLWGHAVRFKSFCAVAGLRRGPRDEDLIQRRSVRAVRQVEICGLDLLAVERHPLEVPIRQDEGQGALRGLQQHRDRAALWLERVVARDLHQPQRG